MTSWDDCDCKNTEGGKRAVIKGVGNVVLIHGLSEACLESLPAASGEAALRGTQTVRGSSSRGMTAEDSASALTLVDTQSGRAGWAFPESERSRERHLKIHALEEKFRGAGGNTLGGQDNAHKVSSIQEVNLQGGKPLEFRARISQGL